MTFVVTESIPVTTDASGNATVYSANQYSGPVRTVTYTKTSFDDGSTITVTGETSGQNIWTQSNVNATATVCPRQGTHSQAGVASLYAAAGTAVQSEIYLANERIKIVIASGGNAKVGAFRVVVG